MSNIKSYQERIKDFKWSISEEELNYKDGDNINIGWYCSDRICNMGMADKQALIWEGLGGVEKKYTFNDVEFSWIHQVESYKTISCKSNDRSDGIFK